MRHMKMTLNEIFMDIFTITVVFLFTLLCLYPLIFVAFTSLSNAELLKFEGNVTFFPRGFSLESYRVIFMDEKIPRYYVNSVIYAITSTACTILVTALTGYALSVKDFFIRKFMTIMMTITMFIGGGLIPYYLVVKSLGLVNSMLVMIIPGALNVWFIIVFKTFFQQHPVELRESAYLDGANDFVILFRIILPISVPLLATFSIFGIVGSWNDYFTAMIFIQDDLKNPIQILLRRILVVQQMEEEMKRFNTMNAALARDMRTVKSAVIIITVLPIITVYPFFQKYFTKGIIIGSLKG